MVMMKKENLLPKMAKDFQMEESNLYGETE
jgi:hypothetical protein